MTDIAAAIGIEQLARAWTLREQREAIAESYFRLLADLPLDLPSRAPESGIHAWHLFTVCVRKESRATRDDLIAALAADGIGSSVHYRPLHRMSYWSTRYPSQAGEFPGADDFFERTLTLPLFPGMTAADIDAVSDVLHRVLG